LFVPLLHIFFNFESRKKHMSILSQAKAKATRGNVKEAFKNEAGAIDLASIMVGIIVIGLIGGVIAATVFAVIPWAQDNAAKQQLDSISSAQSAYIGLSADGPTGAGTAASFGGGAIVAPVAPATAFTLAADTASINRKVVGADGSVTQKLFDGAAAKVVIGNLGTGSDAHYAAAAKSASGKVFYITDTKTQPTNQATTAATGFAVPVVAAANAL
jgi:type II secretory pathway pseudopilin PulG